MEQRSPPLGSIALASFSHSFPRFVCSLIESGSPPKRESSIINVFEVCCNTANFIPELRALQTSLDLMLSRIGCFGDTVDTKGLNLVEMILIHGQI